MRADGYALDVGSGESLRGKLMMESDCSFDSGLRMKLRWERYLEEHVLHHVAAVRPLELELLATEADVVETPRLRCEHTRITHLAGLRDEREANSTRGGVSGSPTLARSGIGRVAIGTQRLTIHPGERNRVEH